MTTYAVAIWILTGLIAGWIARFAMRSRRAYGVLGDLTTGCLGALIGGWLLRRLDVWTPDTVVGHVLIALVGAAVLLAGVRLLWHLGAATRLVRAPEPATPGGNLHAQVRRASDFQRRMLSSFLSRRHTPVDVNQAFDAQLTVGEHVADMVAAFGGSWTFIGMFFAAMISWMMLNEDMTKPFDPYPFILLNLILSCLAAVQAPIIMMSQNRQAAKDRLDARNDFEVNLRAEMEIMALHEKLDRMQIGQLQELRQMLEEQTRRLESLELSLRAAPRAPGQAASASPEGDGSDPGGGDMDER